MQRNSLYKKRKKNPMLQLFLFLLITPPPTILNIETLVLFIKLQYYTNNKRKTFTCKAYCKILADPRPTRKPSMAPMKACTT